MFLRLRPSPQEKLKKKRGALSDQGRMKTRSVESWPRPWTDPSQPEGRALLDTRLPKSHPLGGLWAERTVRDWLVEVMDGRGGEGGAAL